jgi:hypothetical protein
VYGLWFTNTSLYNCVPSCLFKLDWFLKDYFNTFQHSVTLTLRVLPEKKCIYFNLWCLSFLAEIFLVLCYISGRGKSIWDTFSQKPGNVDNNETGNDACMSYKYYEKDVKILQALGVSFHLRKLCMGNTNHGEDYHELLQFSVQILSA